MEPQESTARPKSTWAAHAALPIAAAAGGAVAAFNFVAEAFVNVAVGVLWAFCAVWFAYVVFLRWRELRFGECRNCSSRVKKEDLERMPVRWLSNGDVIEELWCRICRERPGHAGGDPP